MSIKDVVMEIKKEYKGLGIIGSFFSFFQGRATTFAIVFTVVGIRLAFLGKLTADYVALVSAIQALVVGHSIKEDYFQRRSCDDSQPKD
jgi:hypothetical protein